MKWQRMRPGNPIVSAIIDFMRKQISCSGAIDVTCAPSTDIDGLYRVIVDCPTPPESSVYFVKIKDVSVYFVKIKDAAIVRWWGE